MLNAEMDFHLENALDKNAIVNTRNWHGKKSIQGKFGQIEFDTPRDRLSTFQPKIIPRRSTKIVLLEDAILSLYSIC